MQIKGKYAELITSVFQSLLITYLLLLLIETIWPLAVSFYININYLLLVVIAIGILSVFCEVPKEKSTPMTIKDWAFISLLAIIAFILLKYQTADLGGLSWVISIIAALLIFFIGQLIYEEEEQESTPQLSTKQWTLLGVGIALVVIVALSLFTTLTFLSALRVVFGGAFVLFLPGYLISLILLKNIDVLERIAVSFALSIAIVPLVVFYLNLMGMRISALNVFITVTVICLLAGGYLYYKKFYTKKTTITPKRKSTARTTTAK